MYSPDAVLTTSEWLKPCSFKIEIISIFLNLTFTGDINLSLRSPINENGWVPQ